LGIPENERSGLESDLELGNEEVGPHVLAKCNWGPTVGLRGQCAAERAAGVQSPTPSSAVQCGSSLSSNDSCYGRRRDCPIWRRWRKGV